MSKGDQLRTQPLWELWSHRWGRRVAERVAWELGREEKEREAESNQDWKGKRKPRRSGGG